MEEKPQRIKKRAKAKTKKTGYILGLIAFGLIFILNFFVGVFETLEYKSYDYRLKLRGNNIPIDNILIAAIDEDSLEHYGRWPWDRKVHVKLIDSLTAAGAKVILFDVLFLEKSDTASDRALVQATNRTGNVVHEVLFEFSSGGIPCRERAPIAGLADAASHIGFPNVFVEIDGIVRKIKPIIIYDGKVYMNIALAVSAAYLDKPWQEIMRGVNVDAFGEMLINYQGRFETFQYVSCHKIISGDFEKDLFKDKIVLVGYAAAGLGDRHVTPFALMPGIETIASNINAFINSSYIYYSPWYVKYLSLLIIGGILIFFLPRLSANRATVLAFLVFIIWTGIVWYFFSAKNVWIEWVAVAFFIFIAYLSITSWRFLSEEKEKRMIKNTFKQYVSSTVVDEILKDPSKLNMGGERRELTVFFSDVRAFTTYSESHTPEQVVEVLNEYLDAMTKVIFKWNGTLDKYVGDEIMAVWGAPLEQPNHAELALRCCWEQLAVLRELQEQWRQAGRDVIDIGMGLNTGEMIIGNIGSSMLKDYTVIGDAVNLGARLEAETRNHGTPENPCYLIISEFTYAHVKDIAEVKHLGSVKVKGKNLAVTIYEVLDVKG